MMVDGIHRHMVACWGRGTGTGPFHDESVTHLRLFADAEMLCGAPHSYDVPGLYDVVTCAECVVRVCLAIATPAERCQYCRITWGLGHETRCPLLCTRHCSICLAPHTAVVLVGLYIDGKFRLECRTCRDERPRSGRYSFVEAGCGGTAHHGIGTRGAK